MCSRKQPHDYGKSPSWMGKLTINFWHDQLVNLVNMIILHFLVPSVHPPGFDQKKHRAPKLYSCAAELARAYPEHLLLAGYRTPTGQLHGCHYLPTKSRSHGSFSIAMQLLGHLLLQWWHEMTWDMNGENKVYDITLIIVTVLINDEIQRLRWSSSQRIDIHIYIYIYVSLGREWIIYPLWNVDA